MSNQVKAVFQDSQGNEAVSEFAVTTTNQTLVTNILAQMQALSDLELVEYQFTKEISPGPTGSGPSDLDNSHPYADDKSALIMEWSTSNRKVKPRISIPGPKFLDGIGDPLYKNDLVLDQTDVLVTTLITKLTAYACSSGNTALSLLRRGYIDIRRGKRAAR